MSTSSTRRPRSVFRRLERWFVGMVMAVIAFVLERAVMRSVRKKGEAPKPESTTLTYDGGEVDLPD